jgi:hypothetical protein
LLQALLKGSNQFLASGLTRVPKSFADLIQLPFDSLKHARTHLRRNSPFRRPRLSGSSKLRFHLPDLCTKLLGSVLLTCRLSFTKRVSQFF